MAKRDSTFTLGLISLLAWIVSLSIARASEFHYFDQSIDYWNSNKSEKKVEVESSKKVEASEKSESFDWKKHLDPKNPEFFKEGDYTPPEAFMEITRNPTDENLKMWFQYIDKKNALATRLQTRMNEYLEKEGAKLEPAAKESLRATSSSFARIPEDSKRYRFRLYFDSTCPHCRHMFDTLKTLQDRGYYVEARQIDSRTETLEDLPLPTTRATPEEVQKQQIESVPFLLIGDLKSQAVYKMTGFQTPESIFELLHSHQPPTKGNIHDQQSAK